MPNGVYIYMEGDWKDPKVQKTVQQIEKNLSSKVTQLGTRNVPWFPSKISDIDLFSKSTLDAGVELSADHPGFQDAVYRKRREEIAFSAANYHGYQPIPLIEYTDVENKTWNIAYNELSQLFEEYACDEYQESLKALEDSKVYSPHQIPQLRYVSDFLKKTTGFTLRPVAGLISGRDFLNALAFRVFFSTQYIRHHSVPLYTPEPDVIHELLGHAPMLASPNFADFSQLIGIASLGATDEQIRLLSTVYWFSVEFGLIYQDNKLKAYGAGLLSSFGELQFATSPTNGKCEIREWNPFVASTTPYPITTYQPIYFAARSLEDVKSKVLEFCKSLQKPFSICYCPDTQIVVTDVLVNPTPVSLKL
ncbi:aromatic amino acid hydrolase AAH1 [Cardiosporidium cionae]|uniref:phenylalanine 4-monooxygenase n=1 Tax=Cardiosporidium cionae TaxID=476202 RepID=A0ABQ7JEZ3_9APIC|nr:aromatic amino acid hydrolase AAH1 [Cardiosporidium cionae]|eukprot:KAF8822568.1 aromatic amino acid hydrolase AAH1 [Cardiosporidium cionae]